MKLNTRDLLRKWQFPLLVLSAIGPIGPSLFCYLIPDAWALSWVFPGICLALACFGMLLEKKLRKLWGYAGFAVLLVTGWILLAHRTSISYGYTLFLVPVLCGFALLVILPMADLPRHKEPHAAVFVTGIFLYLFWQVFYRIRITSGDPAMEPASASIIAGFFLFLMLTLLSRNRSSLSFASMGRFSLPPVMQRVNRLLIIVFLGGVLLLGAVPFIGSVLAAPIVWAFRGLTGLLGAFLTFKPTEQAPLATKFPEVRPPQSDFAENVYKGEGVRLPETATQILVVLFILALGYFVIRALVILVRFLFRLLRSMTRSTEAGEYEDEVSDVRDTVTQLAAQPKGKKLSLGQRKQLSPSQQIRYRYRVLKKRHPKWKSSQTVRSQLPEEAARLYERTRYGGKEADAGDARAFETKTRGL